MSVSPFVCESVILPICLLDVIYLKGKVLLQVFSLYNIILFRRPRVARKYSKVSIIRHVSIISRHAAKIYSG